MPTRERLEDAARLERRPPRPPGDGELGDKGCAAFLSEPRFEGLPALFEGPGVEGKAPGLVDVEKTKALRKKGLAARSGESASDF